LDRFNESDILRMKESKFESYVEQACKIYKLKYKPKVFFQDGRFTELPDANAYIELTSNTIYVSRAYLLEATDEDIKETAFHEVTHIFNAAHDTAFYNKLDDSLTDFWVPPGGLRVINGNKLRIPTRKEKKEETKPDNTICNRYSHNCKKKTKLTPCPYCKKYFCDDHYRAVPPSMPHFRNSKKFYEWKEWTKKDNFHPCPEYAIFIMKQEKIKNKRYREALDRMSGRGKKFQEIQTSYDKTEEKIIQHKKQRKDPTPSQISVNNKEKNKDISSPKKDEKVFVTCDRCGQKIPESEARKTYSSKHGNVIKCYSCYSFNKKNKSDTSQSNKDKVKESDKKIETKEKSEDRATNNKHCIVKIRINDIMGKPYKKCNVLLLRIDENYFYSPIKYSAETDQDGKIKLSVLPGKYTIQASSEKHISAKRLLDIYANINTSINFGFYVINQELGNKVRIENKKVENEVKEIIKKQRKKEREDKSPKTLKKPLYKHQNKFISWFFWKTHPRSKLWVEPTLKNLGLFIGITIFTWVIFSNIKILNDVDLGIIKLGSLIFLIFLIATFYYLYKLLQNLKYGVRGLQNGYKLILSIVLLSFCLYIYLTPSALINPISEFNYESLNPFNIENLPESAEPSIKNPTYNELSQFVLEDTTDSNQYQYYTYVCEDFSRDVIHNAKEKGIRAGMVYLYDPTETYGDHAIVAIETSDEGLYFLEPQLDVLFSEGHMNSMVNRGIYDIQTIYGGGYYGYGGYFNMPLARYEIQYWNDDLLGNIPGFEFSILLFSLLILLYYWNKK